MLSVTPVDMLYFAVNRFGVDHVAPAVVLHLFGVCGKMVEGDPIDAVLWILGHHIMEVVALEYVAGCESDKQVFSHGYLASVRGWRIK